QLGFSFHDRGERHGLVQIKAGGDVGQLRSKMLTKITYHYLNDFGNGCSRSELVRVRKEIAFECLRLQSEIADQFRIGGHLVPLGGATESVGGENASDGKAIQALANGDGLQNDVAANQLLDDVGGGNRARESVN